MSLSVRYIEKLAENYYQQNKRIEKKAMFWMLVSMLLPFILPLFNQLGKAKQLSGAADKLLENLKEYEKPGASDKPQSVTASSFNRYLISLAQESQATPDNPLGLSDTNKQAVSEFYSYVAKLRSSLSFFEQNKDLSKEHLSNSTFQNQFLEAAKNFEECCDYIERTIPQIQQILVIARGAGGEAFDSLKQQGYTLGMGTKASNASEAITEIQNFLNVEKPAVQKSIDGARDIIKKMQSSQPNQEESKPEESSLIESQDQKTEESTAAKEPSKEDSSIEDFSTISF